MGKCLSTASQLSYNMDKEDGKFTRLVENLSKTAEKREGEQKRDKSEKEAKKLISSLKGGRRRSLLAQAQQDGTTSSSLTAGGALGGSALDAVQNNEGERVGSVRRGSTLDNIAKMRSKQG